MTGRRKVNALTIDKAKIVSHCELVKEELDIDINDRTMRAILYKTFKSNQKIVIRPLKN